MRGRFVTAALWIFREIKTPRGAHCTISRCWDSHLDPQCQHITWQQDGRWQGNWGGGRCRLGLGAGRGQTMAFSSHGWIWRLDEFSQFPPSSSAFTHTSSRGGRRRAVAEKNHLWPHVDLQPNAHRDWQAGSIVLYCSYERKIIRTLLFLLWLFSFKLWVLAMKLYFRLKYILFHNDNNYILLYSITYFPLCNKTEVTVSLTVSDILSQCIKMNLH